jgi:hypothetical protein
MLPVLRIGVVKKSCSWRHKSYGNAQGFAQKYVQMSDRERNIKAKRGRWASKRVQQIVEQALA